jgi:hypothetical protein
MSLMRGPTSDVKFTVGGVMEEEASRNFIDAWHRAERGESFHERLLAFESWDALARVLTGKRMELLRTVRRNNVPSVRALAKALSREEARAVEVRGLPPFAKNAKDGAPIIYSWIEWGTRRGRTRFMVSHPSQSTRRMGHPSFIAGSRR